MKIKVYRPAYEIWSANANWVGWTTGDQLSYFKEEWPSWSVSLSIDNWYVVEDIDGNKLGIAHSVFSETDTDEQSFIR